LIIYRKREIRCIKRKKQKTKKNILFNNITFILNKKGREKKQRVVEKQEKIYKQ